MKNNKPYALVFGMSIYDIFGFSHSTFRSHDSNPGKVKVSCGGVCRNIAENMSLVGVNTQFISILGDDEKGNDILRRAEKVGLDMSNTLIVEGGSTPTYMAILDADGEMVAAVVDTKLANQFSKEELDNRHEIIENSEYMFIGADNPPFVEYLVTKYQGKTRFVLDPVSGTKASRVKHLLPYFHTVKPNRQEAEVLCGFEIKTNEDIKRAGEYLHSLGVEKVFISLDVEGVYFSDGKQQGVVRAAIDNVANVTGAGDAFVAGIGAGYMENKSTLDTVKYAISMSNITITHEETINPNISHEMVTEYMNSAEWEMNIF